MGIGHRTVYTNAAQYRIKASGLRPSSSSSQTPLTSSTLPTTSTISITHPSPLPRCNSSSSSPLSSPPSPPLPASALHFQSATSLPAPTPSTPVAGAAASARGRRSFAPSLLHSLSPLTNSWNATAPKHGAACASALAAPHPRPSTTILTMEEFRALATWA